MKSREIRETFLSFFEGKGHTRVPSASAASGYSVPSSTTARMPLSITLLNIPT